MLSSLQLESSFQPTDQRSGHREHNERENNRDETYAANDSRHARDELTANDHHGKHHQAEQGPEHEARHCAPAEDRRSHRLTRRHFDQRAVPDRAELEREHLKLRSECGRFAREHAELRRGA